jgi:hypothetical protein
LPARFDDTQIPGIRPTIGFIDLRNYTPEQFANMIKAKLSGGQNLELPQKKEDIGDTLYFEILNSFTLTGSSIELFFGLTITNLNKETRYFQQPYFLLSDIADGTIKSFILTDISSPMQFPIELKYGQQIQVKYQLIPKQRFFYKKIDNPEATLKSVIVTTIGEKFESNSQKIATIIRAFEDSFSYPKDLKIMRVENQQGFYLFSDGILRPIDNHTFNLLYRNHGVQTINKHEFDIYQLKEPFESIRTAKIVRIHGEPECFVILDGFRHFIPNPKTLQHITDIGNPNANAIEDISRESLKSIPQREDLISI